MKKNVRSPTPGVVSIVHKKAGDAVSAEDEVIFIECMKMEIPVVAGHSGHLVSIHVKPGDSVAEDEVLAVIES